MVSLLPQRKVEIDASSRAGDSSLVRGAPSILRPPAIDCTPHQVLAKGIVFAGRFDNQGEDEELTQQATEILGLDMSISVFNDEQSNVASIDTHSVFHYMAIGPRLELLNKYYPLSGKWLLWLIGQCPLNIWTPRRIAHLSEYSDERDGGIGDLVRAMYPDWAMAEPEWRMPGSKTPPRPPLPPNLSRIVDECLAQQEVVQGEWHDEISEMGFIVCTWYGNVPYHDRRVRKQALNPYITSTSEHGTNAMWCLIDEIGDHAMQAGLDLSCNPIFHNLEVLDETLRASAPYIKLMKYLNHEKQDAQFEFQF